MQIGQIIEFLESWLPPGSALAKDNPGLQVGDPEVSLTNVLVTLDVTDAVIDEAIENRVNLILSHHPLIFQPLQRLSAQDISGRRIVRLMQHGVAVYSAHTNLNASRDGVSMVLAKLLGVEKPRFLVPPDERWLKKIAVFVPSEHLNTVREAMAQAGAGVIGDYSHCSFNIPGSGTFLGSEASAPTVGVRGNLESVSEMRLEMILPGWKLDAVVHAMKAVHPYEEVAYDVYPLDNRDVNFGFGAIGELPIPIDPDAFIERVRHKLNVEAVGVVRGPAKTISRLAVCGGSGGDLAEAAWKQKADAFVTGEAKYHTFLDCRDRLTVIVAGHYASERVIVPVWAERVRRWLGGEPVSVLESRVNSNPLTFIS